MPRAIIVVYKTISLVYSKKPKSASSKSSRLNLNSIEEDTTDKSVNAIQNTNYNPECVSDYNSLIDNMVASILSTTVQIDPKNTTLQIGNTKIGLLIESGSVGSILVESLAIEVINNSILV